jgi:hypothetical protein
MNDKQIAFLKAFLANWIVPALGAATAAQWNPLPEASAFHPLVPLIAGIALTRVSLYLHPNGLKGPASPAPSKPGGFVLTRIALGMLLACVLVLASLSACSLLGGSSGTIAPDGQAADLNIVIPDGTQIGVQIAKSEACVAGPFVSVPYFGLECDKACGAILNHGLGVELTCRLKGQTNTFPWAFGVPLPQQQKAATLVSVQPGSAALRYRGSR